MADISERAAFIRMIDALTALRDSARALALLRSDERWLVIANGSQRMKDNAEQLFTKSRRQGSNPIVTPAGVPIRLSKAPGEPQN